MSLCRILIRLEISNLSDTFVRLDFRAGITVYGGYMGKMRGYENADVTTGRLRGKNLCNLNDNYCG